MRTGGISKENSKGTFEKTAETTLGIEGLVKKRWQMFLMETAPAKNPPVLS